jgi:hypothetical protein
MYTIIDQVLQATLNLLLRIAAPAGVCIECLQHAYDPPAFLTSTTGEDAICHNVRCMAGYLVTLEIRITINQGLLNQKLRKRAENRELTDPPSFSMIVPGQNIVKKAALVIEAAVVRNTSVGGPPGRIELISDEDTTDTSFSENRKYSKEKHSHRPQTDRVFI